MDTPSLESWHARLAELDDSSPWPGPVPLSMEQSALAVGRDEDERRIVNIVRSHALVVLHADSGVGKSSFLSAVARPALEERYRTFLIESWSDLPEEVGIDSAERQGAYPPLDVDRIFFERLFGRPPDTGFGDLGGEPDSPGPRRLGTYLENRYGRNAVLVLDQFEELIRDNPALFAAICSWIDQVVVHHKVRIIVSLRSEYEHQIRDLGRVRPALTRELRLEPIVEERDIRRVILGSPTSADMESPITPQAAEKVFQSWSQSLQSPSRHDPGLLQLQGLMYVLYHRARNGQSGLPIQAGDVDRFSVDALKAGDTVLDFALTKVVELKLAHCEEAGHKAGLDVALREGTKSIAQRCVGHLSSGGFKLVVRDRDLFNYALERERRVHGIAPGLAENEFAALVDATAGAYVTPGTHPDPSSLDAGTRETTSKSAHDWPEGFQPWEEDSDDVTSGHMMGMSPSLVMVEEVRRFLFAVEWLKAAHLVRSSGRQASQRMVALIHDGFANPLERWARDTSTTAEQAVNLLTAARGETFSWWHRPSGPAPVDVPTIESQVVANVRWRDCYVQASFKDATFVNCDFQGTRFDRCRFEGVVFLNCMLDGASIRNSQIVGSPSLGRPLFDAEPPSFQVDAPNTATAIRRYRGSADGQPSDAAPTTLFSETSGVPAIPLRELTSAQQERTKDWASQPGGVTLYGGRVYSLMIQHCDFTAGHSGAGQMAFCGISGSSLDFVDPADAKVTIFGSAIRGLSVTVNDETRRLRSTKNVQLHAEDSLLAGTWFGDELVGSADFSNCSLWQMWNNSQLTLGDSDAGLTVDITGSSYFGLVNVSSIDEHSPVLGSGAAPPVLSANGDDGSAKVVDRDGRSGREVNLARGPGSSMVDGANRMEYQAEPAAQEFERRRKGSRNSQPTP